MNKTIISVTPVSLNRDSRTLKMAATFARNGLRSIVVEKELSNKDYSHLGIEVISLAQKDHLTSRRNLVGITVETSKMYDIRSYAIHYLKFVWKLLKKLKLSWITDFISYLEFLRHYKKQYSLMSCLLPKADIYYFHSYEYTHFALKLSKNAFIAYDAHDFYANLQPSDQHSSLVRNWILPYQRRLEQKLINRSNIFLTVSDGLAQKYEAIYGKKPYVIRNVHDKRIDVTTDNNIRTRLQLNESSFIICTVGNYKLGMAYEELIEAFSKLADDNHLVFIGRGYEKLTIFKNNIHFIAPLQPTEVVPFIKSADCGLLNYFDFTESYKYALPNGLFQTIAARLPLLYSRQLVEIDSLNHIFKFGVPINVKCVDDVIKGIKKMKIKKNRDYYKKNVERASEEIMWEKEEKKLLQFVLKDEPLPRCR